MMKTIVNEYIVDKTKIGFIRFIFEAHEGVGVITTIDAKKGHIKLIIAPDRLSTANLIIDDLKKGFQFNEIHG